jgi:hypothetical protein
VATYSLTGSGTQALSSNVTALHISATTIPTNIGTGNANPINYYSLALLRLGDATGFMPAVQLEASPAWLAVPAGSTRLGYACLGGSALSVVEVIGGTPPFGGTASLAGLSDVALASPADTQILTYQASSAKWINANAPSGGGSSPSGSMVLLSTTFLASNTASLTITPPSSGYRNLFIDFYGSANTTVMRVVNCTINADATTAHYNATAGSGAGDPRIGVVWASTTAGYSGRIYIVCPTYSTVAANHQFFSFSNRTDTPGGELNLQTWTPSSSASVTSIVLTPASGFQFATNSFMLVWGSAT